MPNCDSSLTSSPRAGELTINELIANVFCVLKEIATTLNEWLHLRRCSRIKEVIVDDVDEIEIGVPFIPVGFKGENDSDTFVSYINIETWTIYFNENTSADSVFLYYEL
jgi:hypothetical protein